jgi:hypothetical protein
LNLFKTDLNKSKIPLFIRARPTFSFPGRPRQLTGRSSLSAPRSSLLLPLPDGSRSLATPPPGTVVVAPVSISPLPLCSAGRDPPSLVPRFLHASARFPDPHRPLPHPPPPKKGPHNAAAPRSPFPSSVLTPSTPRANPPSHSHPPHPRSAAPAEFRPQRRRHSPAR